MKIAVAQITSIKADITTNINHHMRVIDHAAAHSVDLLVFPELSLTGYEPTIAKETATTLDDRRLMRLQALAEKHDMAFGVGAPMRRPGGITISMFVFEPGKPTGLYDKRHLHPDEEPYFIPDTITSHALPDAVALAICHEISVPEHAETAHKRGASIYVASVAKTHDGVATASDRLAEIARQYGMTVFMSNCVGTCEGQPAGGGSAVWNSQGEVIAQMDDVQEGFIVYDPAQPSAAPEVVESTLSGA